jgi:uncharacterized membrane protein (UPF0182 family)
MTALVTAAVLLIVGRSLAGVYSDYLWYEALGAGALWRLRMNAVGAMRFGSGAAAALFAFINLYAVRQSVVSLVLPRRLGNLEIGEEVPGRFLLGATVALAVILGVLLAMPSDNWTSFALAWNHKPFNETDPYFSQDLGFYAYWLPFESLAWIFTLLVVMVTSIAVVLLYALTPSLKWQRGSLYASAYVRRHMTMLVGVLLLLLAWSFRLDMYELLIDGTGPDHAFTWVDHHVSVTADLLLSLLALSVGLIVLWAGYVGRLRLAAIGILGVVILAVAGREIAPALFAHVGTDQQRAAREQPYIATRATYTRRAFDVDRIVRADSAIGFASLTAALPSLPMWDPPALVRALNAGRAATDYPMLIGWRAAPDGLVAGVIDSPPGNATARAPWTASRVIAADADERGAPIRLASLASFGDDAPIDAPIVYPHAPPTLVIADSLTHVAGTLLESFATRFATAWSTQNFRLLVDDLAQPHPTLVSHRDVRDRLDMYVPFFAQGRSVEPLLAGDSLYWAVHLYSATDSYPLSAHYRIVGDDRAFLHHAAVAIVQASTGDVMVVPDSLPDPITESWKAQVPSLFTTWAALPPGMRMQLDPPIDAIVAQANAFGRFGTRGQTDVMRRMPARDGSDTAVVGDHLPLALPGGQGTALSIPLVDNSDRVRGVLLGAGSSDGNTLTWLPLDAPGPRWTSVLDRLRAVDSANIGVRDGQLVHGRVRVVPLRTGLAFIQPTYRWHGSSAPTLNRMLVLMGDSVRSVAPPLVAGPAPAPVVAGPAAPSTADFHGSVAALYAAMRDALRRGDFAAFGRAFDALGKALDGRRQ